MKILHIDSSILGHHSISRELTKAIVARLKVAATQAEIIYRDLTKTLVPHQSEELLALKMALSKGSMATQDATTVASAATQNELALLDRVLEEFLAADVIVIGAPMYNHSIPSQLKTWIDGINVAGKTFRYTENGPIGLIKGKRVIIASSRGGFYAGDAPAASFDHQESFLKSAFTFLGIDEIEIIRAEGVSINAELRKKAMESAMDQIAAVAIS
jgi:FMN-dependent NADH-azoreductase